MLAARASGILLHPTSLPSRGGIGDFGPAAYEFIDFLVAARQTVWQVLPLNPIGVGNSPYSSTSAFAGNKLLISLERLADRGWIDRKRLDALANSAGDVDYDQVHKHKLPLLRESADNFRRQANGNDRQRFDAWCRDVGWWLEDFVLFDVIRTHHNFVSWKEWPRELARREPDALARVRDELRDEIERERVIQFAFFEQWRNLHQTCRRRGLRMMGDVAIFVNYDSADVWTHPDIFRLNADLQPEVVSGVPPDAFSETGQYWGNPLYRWEVLRQRGYNWWVQRIQWAMQQCDLIRLDHFRGFESYWEIPAHEPTAVHGRWQPGPADDLFHRLREALGSLPFIAEDLGMITPAVHAFRARLGIPGMRVLQFGFSDPGAHMYLPHRFEPNTVVYTGTHDNDTTLGWWQCCSDKERAHAASYLGGNANDIHWELIRAAAGSVAALCIFPLQDILGLGSEARMNVPSRADGNWTWRYRPGTLTKELAERLATLVEVSDRDEWGRSKAGQQSHWETGEHFAA
jgi:4-alpha-glucanotransferase